MSFKLVLSAALCALAAAPAAAVPVFFTDRAAFQAAAGPLSTESFDAISVSGGTFFQQPSGIAVSGSGGTGTFGLELVADFISEGTGSLQVQSFNIGGAMLIDHTGPLTAFGVDFLDINSPVAMDLVVNGVAQAFASPLVHTTPQDGPLFLGVVDAETPFVDVRIVPQANLSLVNLDFLQFGSQSVVPGGGGPGGGDGSTDVPLPAGGALLLGALAALGLHRGRRG